MSPVPERRWRVGVILVGIAGVLVLPGLAFSTFLLLRFADAERAEARSETIATAARVADAVDHELGTLVVAARVLATSRALVAGDIQGFQQKAEAAAELLGQRILIASPDGSVVYSTVAAAAKLSPTVTGLIQRTAQDRQPQISDLFETSLGAARIAVFAPVMRDGVAAYVLSISVSPGYFSNVLELQLLPPGWIASIRDGQGRLFARNVDAERFIGQRLTGTGVKAGEIKTGSSLQGHTVLSTTAKLKLTNWHVGIGVPVTAFDRPIRNSIILLALSGAATLLIASVLAWVLARSVSRPLMLLASAGDDLGAGRPVRRVGARITEVADLSNALVLASADLNARTAALAAERARLAAIIETVPVGLMIADAPDGRIISGNRHLSRILPQAMDAADAGATACFDETGEQVPITALPLSRALAGEDPAELQCRFRRPDGSLFWVRAVAAPIRGREAEVSGAVLALLDVDEVIRAREQQALWTERLEEEVVARTVDLEHANQRLRDEVSARSRAEDQLRQAQKMEAVGRLTGGIAHDFNNLLTIIIGSLDLLRRSVDSDKRLLRLVDNASEGASRAAGLTASLLAFARRQPLVPQAVDVNRLVQGMSNLLRRTLGETIQVDTVLGDAVWPAMVDPNQLESALLNLAVNARDAIHEASPGGGRLRLETYNVSVDELYAAQVSGSVPGDYVVIATGDSGVGMSPETLAQVFEPFFTTKPTGHGTGLGLSQVHGFAAQSGGHVAIESELGHGTTVRLFLPRLHRPENPSLEPQEEVSVPRSQRGETILLVEDEDGVRYFTISVLRELGYSVVETSNAKDALSALAAHPDTSLLMTDVIMAGMNGRELARLAKEQRPDLAVLLTSGYSPVDPAAEDPHWELLGKPYTVASLASKVNKALRREA